MKIAPHDTVELPDDSGYWWWACSAPERPGDGWCCYLVPGCRSCRIAMEAKARLDPDSTMDRRDQITGAPLGEMSTAALVYASVTDQRS